MQLCHERTILAYYSLANVAIGPDELLRPNRIHQNEQSYTTVVSCKWALRARVRVRGHVHVRVRV